MPQQNVLGISKLQNYSCPITNFTTALTTYGTINWTDMLIDIDEYPEDTKCELIVYWTNTVSSAVNYIQLFDQFASSAVTGSEITETITTANTKQIIRTSVPFDLNSGLTSYMIQAKVSAGTMTTVKVELKLTI